MKTINPRKFKFKQSLGDEPLDMPILEDFPCQISPRENKETLKNIVDRTHDKILIKRENIKLQKSIDETKRKMKEIME